MRVPCSCGISFEADGTAATCPVCANRITIATDSPGTRPMCPECGEPLASIDATCDTCHPPPDDEVLEYVAWEDGSRPLLKRWWKTFWSFETVPARGSLRQPFLFVLFTQFLVWSVASVLLLVLTSTTGKDSLAWMFLILAVALPLLFTVTTITLVLWTGVLHFVLRRFGGVGDFGATWRCCCYCMSMFFIPGTSWWIRGGMAFGILLYSTFSLCRAHRISWGRTFLAGLLPACVLLGPTVLKPLIGIATSRMRDAGILDLAPTMPRSIPDKSLTADQRTALRDMRAIATKGHDAIRAAITAADGAALKRERDAIVAACDRAAAAVPESPESHYWRARTLRLCGEDGLNLPGLTRVPKTDDIYVPHALEIVFHEAAMRRSDRRGRLDAAIRHFHFARARDASDGLAGASAQPPILRDLVAPPDEVRRLKRLAGIATLFDKPHKGVSESDRNLARAIGSWARNDFDAARAALGAAASFEAVEIGATLDLECGNYAAALNRVEEALPRFAGHGGLRKILSLARMAEGFRTSDPTLLRRAVEDAEPPVPPITQPSHLKRRAAMARLLLGSKEHWVKVIADLEDETVEATRIIRGCARLLAGDPAAESEFDRLLKDPEDVDEIRLRRGDARTLRGAWADAILDYDAVSDGRRSKAWALSKWSATDPTKARDAADAWSAFTDPVALVHRGDALLALTPPNATEALRCFESAVKACPVFMDRLQPRLANARALVK